MSDKWSFTVRRVKSISSLTIRWTYPWTESPMIHFFIKCFGYPSVSSSPRLPDSHANHAVWPIDARLLLFPSCWSPWLRRFAHERGHVRRRKDGTGLFLSSSVTRGGLKSLAHGLTRRKGVKQACSPAKTQHNAATTDLFLFQSFCTRARSARESFVQKRVSIRQSY